MLNLTLPPLLQRLQQDSGDLNGYLLLYEASIDSFDEVIGICEANVNAMRRRLGRHRSSFCRGLLKLIVRYRSERSSDTARAVYNALQQVIQELANRVEERRITE